MLRMLRSARRFLRVGGSILGVLTVASAMTFTALRADVPAAPGNRTDLGVEAADVGRGETMANRAGGRPDYLDRVVIARMYQNGSWTIPTAKEFTPERKIEYVCKALAYMKPSYVSGLVRLDWKKDSPHLDEQVKVFKGVRTCVRNEVKKDVKFDIALNALHYTDPKYGVPDAKAGTERMLERLRSAEAAFHPDGWFFDFYANPYKNGSGRFPEPLENGITWIHDKKEHKPRQFVGGTIWGKGHKVPPHSDFFAVTDRGGPEYTKDLVRHLRSEHKHTPILMHIDNDPVHKGSMSWKFWRGSAQYRNKVIRQHFRHQDDAGYRYMFPVFFPTRPRHVEVFDMREHPVLFETMCGYVRDHCGPPPAAPGHGTTDPASDRPATTTTTTPVTTGLHGIHRGYHPGSHQHLYSGNRQEISKAPGLRLDLANAFYLDPVAGPGLSPFHRCYLGNGWHLLTTHPTCEGAPGATDEGPLGYLATAQIPGTVPLYRLFRSNKPNHFYTTSTAERDRAAANGYTIEHVAGYVWPAPTK